MARFRDVLILFLLGKVIHYMLKVIIAEDDSIMRRVLKQILMEIPGVSIIGEAENGQQLVEMVEELEPEVVFLDMDMPEMSGLEVSRKINEINVNIFLVFATGYNCYTHKAFDVYAFDYLVKPFNLERIKHTIQRIKKLKTVKDGNDLLKLESPLDKGDHIKLKIVSNDKSTYINISDIVLITRCNRKTMIYEVGDIVLQTYESLQDLIEKLGRYHFFRCHKSFIINPKMVRELSPWGNKSYLVKLANTKETALMTLECAKEFQNRYCI